MEDKRETPSEPNSNLNKDLDNASDSKEHDCSGLGLVSSVESLETLIESDNEEGNDEEIEDQGNDKRKHWQNMEWNVDPNMVFYSDTAADIDSQAIPFLILLVSVAPFLVFVKLR